MEGEETRGEGGTGTCNCNGDRMTDWLLCEFSKEDYVVDGRFFL